MSEPMLTVEQCADRLNCHRSLVRRLIGAGKIQASKIGGGWRVESAHLEEYIARQRQIASPPVIADSERLPVVVNPRFQ